MDRVGEPVSAWTLWQRALATTEHRVGRSVAVKTVCLPRGSGPDSESLLGRIRDPILGGSTYTTYKRTAPSE